MKKSTYIAAFITGAGIAALWALRKKKQPKTIKEVTDKEDGFVSFAIAPTSPIKEIRLPASIRSTTPKNRSTSVSRAVLKKAEVNRPSKAMKGISAIGSQIVQSRYGDVIKPRPDIVKYQKYYNYLQKEFEVMQLAVTNHTYKERTVILWGANEEPAVTVETREDIIDKAVNRSFTKFTTEVGVHPQGILVNPANGLIYVANQLSDTVSVLNAEGVVVDTIVLQEVAIPGHHSPVGFAVQNQTSSTNYGKVYVAGSVSNTITVLDLANTVVKSIAVGKRPVAIGFHPTTAKLYVCNLADHTVSVIDAQTEEVIKTLDTGLHPRAITIDEATGNIYVINSGDNSIHVFNKEDELILMLENVSPLADAVLTDAVIHPDQDTLFVVASNANHVLPISLKTNDIGNPIPVGENPHTILYNQNNGFIYVGNRKDNSISVIEGTGEVLGAIERDRVNIGLAFDPNTNAIITSDTQAHTISGIGFREETTITIDGDYEEKREEFKYAPAFIKHVKFILSGKERFNVLSLLHQSVTGQEVVKPIAFSGYNSAQSFANISEVFELENTILDGKHRWKFKIAPKQTITVLVYYYQLEMYKLYEEALKK